MEIGERSGMNFILQPGDESAASPCGSPPADATAARIRHTLETRAVWLKERLAGLGALWDASGWCVVIFPDPESPPWIGKAAGNWLKTHAPGADPSRLTAADLTEIIPAPEILVSSPGLFVWQTASALEAAGTLPDLTRREREVLGWLQRGKTGPEIAIILGCAIRTIEKHVQNLYRKLGIRDRTSLILTHPH